MATRSYEGMFLLDSGRYATNPDASLAEIHDVLSRVDATIEAERPWLDGRLAYPIQKHRKGLHYLIYFKMDSLKAEELNRLCRLQPNILRFLIIQPPDQLYPLMVEALLNPEQANAEQSKEHNTDEDAVSEDDSDTSDETTDDFEEVEA